MIQRWALMGVAVLCLGNTAEDCDPSGEDPCDGGQCADGSVPCPPGVPETCNGEDDDCDGVVDEEPDATATCGAVLGATVACEDGGCAVIACSDPDAADCDGEPTNGCEADTLTSSAHCGACGMACPFDCQWGRCHELRGLSAGGAHTCALATPNFPGTRVVCWGENDQGQLGDGTTVGRHRPVVADVHGDGRFTYARELGLGTDHSCLILDAHGGPDVRCWGRNGEGQLGIPSMGPDDFRTRFEFVEGLVGRPIEIGAGSDRVCVGGNGSPLVCWGDGFAGVEVLGYAGIDEIGTGGAGICLARDDGTVDCLEETTMMPVQVPGLGDARAVAVGDAHACASTVSGDVLCWGANEWGQLGDGTTLGRATPAPVVGLGAVRDVTLGLYFGCALDAFDEVWCWGSNVHGQLGDGTTRRRLEPVLVAGLGPASEVAAGEHHVCAKRTTGEVLCWGRNHRGQLGDGTTTSRTRPVRVRPLGGR